MEYCNTWPILKYLNELPKFNYCIFFRYVQVNLLISSSIGVTYYKVYSF